MGIPNVTGTGTKCDKFKTQQEGKCGWSHVSEEEQQKMKSERPEGPDSVRLVSKGKELDFILHVTGSHWRPLNRKDDQSRYCQRTENGVKAGTSDRKFLLT